MSNDSWCFTFSNSQWNKRRYVRVAGTYSEAKRKMLDKHGLMWGIQYADDERFADIIRQSWLMEMDL